MTCIVGVVDKKRVYIGGDSAGVSNYDISIRKDPKVFKIGKFIFGCTSSFRMIQLIRFSFKLPPIEEGGDIFEYMCTKFIDELRKTFKDGGFKEVKDEVESGGTFLIGYKGRLFQIHNDFQVEELYDEYACCGCGESYAKGALYCIAKDIHPEVKITKALEAAVYFSGGVRPPFIIENA